MKGLLCVLAVLLVCLLANHCDAGCFQHHAAAVVLAAPDYQGVPEVASPCAAAAAYGANFASPYAATFYGYNNFLRQRFVNDVQVQPIVVLKQVRNHRAGAGFVARLLR